MSLTASDWVIAGAALLGPVLAVQAQKWVERARARRARKAWIFETLMATRASRLTTEHVRALNMIDLAFYGWRVWPFGFLKKTKREKIVLDKWRTYLDHLNTPPDWQNVAQRDAWLTSAEELFLDLLEAIAAEVRYEFDRVVLKKGCYSPTLHGTQWLESEALRKGVLQVIGGTLPLHVVVDQPPPPAQGQPRP